jgi:hypothetical protein
METLVIYSQNNDYPDHVIDGVKEAITQADNGALIPFTGIRDMLNLTGIEKG